MEGAGSDFEFDRRWVFEVRGAEVGKIHRAQPFLRPRSNQLVNALLAALDKWGSRLNRDLASGRRYDPLDPGRHDPGLAGAMAGILRPETGQVTQDVERQHRHRQVPCAQVWEGIEA